jgi:hypothetical protein
MAPLSQPASKFLRRARPLVEVKKAWGSAPENMVSYLSGYR